MCSRASHSTQHQNTHVLQSLSLNTYIKYSCALELLAQHKHQILMCLKAHAQHKYLINYVLQGPHPTHENHIHKKNAIGLRPIYKTKHQSNIICNGAYAHKCEVKNPGYYNHTGI